MHHVVSKTLLAPIVALLMLVVPVAEASSLQADLAADQIQSQGMIQGGSNLTALLHPYVSSAGASLSGFELAADHVRVETDYTEVSVVVAEASSNYQLLADTRVDHHQHATARSQQAGVGYRLHVVPLDAGSAHVGIASSCAWQAPSKISEITHDPLVQYGEERPDTIIDTSQAVQWEACDDETVATVTGNFWFSAWSISLEVEDADGMHAYWSGHRDDQAVTEDQELYVYVTNGTLRIPLGAGTGYGLFLGSGASVEVSGSVQLSNARGSLSTPGGIVELDGESMTLDGELEVATRRGSNALQVTLVGDASGAIINGQSLVLAATAPDSTIAFDWWWGLLAFLAVAGLGVRFVVRRYGHLDRVPSMMPVGRREWWALRLLGLALRANERGWHRLSRALAAWAAHWFPELPEARKMVAIASSHVGHIGKAVAALETVYEELPEGRERAEAACCAAASCMRLEDPETAMAWIKRGLPEDPLFVLRRLDKPIYAPLRSQPGFEALQAGSSVLLGRIAMDVAFA